jgi:hypothetical protein
MDLEYFAGRHRNSVARSFKRFGVTHRPGKGALFTAAVVHGEPFVEHLAAEIEKAPESGYEGAKEGEKAKSTLNGILAAVANGLGSYFGNKAGASTAATNNAKPDPEKPKTNWVLIGAIAVIIVLLIVLLSPKK